MLIVDASLSEMEQGVREFGVQLRQRGGTGLFFYAGHGIQHEGVNYLLAVDQEIQEEFEIRSKSFDIGRVLGAMEQAGNPFNIVMLDACRNNPFARSYRSTQQGLAQMDAPSGTLIAYSTSPGRVAADGEGQNSVYTEAFLRHLQTPNLEIGLLFRQVRADVQNTTDFRQVPWESTSLTGTFYFNPDDEGTGQSAYVTRLPVPASISPAPRANKRPMHVVVADFVSSDNAYFQQHKLVGFTPMLVAPHRAIDGAQWLENVLAEKTDQFVTVEPSETQAIQYQRSGLPTKASLLAFLSQTKATHVLFGNVTQYRHQQRAFSGYGVNTRTKTYQLTFQLKLIDLATAQPEFATEVEVSETKLPSSSAEETQIQQSLLQQAVRDAVARLLER